ncbi:hypothetical protein D3C85_1880310 [compost metagenome]
MIPLSAAQPTLAPATPLAAATWAPKSAWALFSQDHWPGVQRASPVMRITPG